MELARTEFTCPQLAVPGGTVDSGEMRMGARVHAGVHCIRLEYRSRILKKILLLLGFGSLASPVLARRKFGGIDELFRSLSVWSRIDEPATSLKDSLNDCPRVRGQNTMRLLLSRNRAA